MDDTIRPVMCSLLALWEPWLSPALPPLTPTKIAAESVHDVRIIATGFLPFPVHVMALGGNDFPSSMPRPRLIAAGSKRFRASEPRRYS